MRNGRCPRISGVSGNAPNTSRESRVRCRLWLQSLWCQARGSAPAMHPAMKWGGSGAHGGGGDRRLLLERRMADVWGLNPSPVTATQRTPLPSQRQPHGNPPGEPGQSPLVQGQRAPPARLGGAGFHGKGGCPWGPPAQSPHCMPRRSPRGVIWGGPDTESQESEEKTQGAVTHRVAQRAGSPCAQTRGWGGPGWYRRARGSGHPAGPHGPGGGAGMFQVEGRFWGTSGRVPSSPPACRRLPRCCRLDLVPGSLLLHGSGSVDPAARTARSSARHLRLPQVKRGERACRGPRSARGLPLGKFYFPGRRCPHLWDGGGVVLPPGDMTVAEQVRSPRTLPVQSRAGELDAAPRATLVRTPAPLASTSGNRRGGLGGGQWWWT